MEPMTQYEFRTTITVDGVKYEAGDIADQDEIPAGTLPNLIRLGQVVEYVPGVQTEGEGDEGDEGDAENAENTTSNAATPAKRRTTKKAAKKPGRGKKATEPAAVQTEGEGDEGDEAGAGSEGEGN